MKNSKISFGFITSKFYPPLNPSLENWWRKRAIILSKTLRQEELNDLIKSFNRWYNARYVAGWKVFEEKQPIDRYVSWEAFIEYVAANPGDRAHDHHWRSQFNQCRICNLDYDLITHLEKSEDEVDFILEKLKVENLTYVGMVSTDRQTDSVLRQTVTVQLLDSDSMLIVGERLGSRSKVIKAKDLV